MQRNFNLLRLKAVSLLKQFESNLFDLPRERRNLFQGIFVQGGLIYTTVQSSILIYQRESKNLVHEPL